MQQVGYPYLASHHAGRHPQLNSKIVLQYTDALQHSSHMPAFEKGAPCCLLQDLQFGNMQQPLSCNPVSGLA